MMNKNVLFAIAVISHQIICLGSESHRAAVGRYDRLIAYLIALATVGGNACSTCLVQHKVVYENIRPAIVVIDDQIRCAASERDSTTIERNGGASPGCGRQAGKIERCDINQPGVEVQSKDFVGSRRRSD